MANTHQLVSGTRFGSHWKFSIGTIFLPLSLTQTISNSLSVILGLSAFYHDSAAALLVDGKLVAAAQEERFTRRKHDDRFPHQALSYCLDKAGIDASEIDHVGFYEKPFLKFERLLETYLTVSPVGIKQFYRSIPQWLGKKLHVPYLW